MAHSCYVSQIGKIKDGLGADVWDELKKTTLGLFIKFTESGFIWAAQTVHFFLTNQLRVDNIHEMWCLIDRRPIRFSLYEFENITGLNCDMFDESDTGETDYKDFWNEMGVSMSVGPLFTELERVFEISKTWSLEKRMMVGRLCLLSVGVHGIHHGSRVPLSSAKRVLDPVAFEKYPWGRVAFDSLLRSVKIVKYDGDSNVIHGCVQTLLVWIYESVPGIGEACGFRKTNLTGVPLLDWRSSRKRFNFTAFIEKEKAAHGQVRVRHMIPVSEENMYPQWSDSAENHDTALDNLLKDIIHNRLQSHAWTHVAARRKRKQNQESSNEDGESKVIESTPTYDVSHKKQRTGKAHIKVDEEEKTSLLDIWNMLEKMNVTISDMDKNASSRLDGLEKKVTCLEASVKTRFEAVETDMRVLKESQPPVVSNEAATSNNNDEYEANSNQCSWIVEEKPGSVDGLPIQRVVKKTVNSVKNKEAATKVLTKKKVAKSDKKKTIVNVEKVEKPKPEMKKTVVKVEKVDSLKPLQKKSVAAPTTKTFDDDVVDVTDKVNADNLKMASSSEETFSNPTDQMANKATADALRALQEGLDNLDGITSKRRRVPQLAGSQKYPYVGNSTVKRIITDVPSSSSVPEHLQPVSDDQFDRLKDWLEPDFEKEGLNTNNFNARFYWQIMTPRNDWPTERYGWLKDYHMGAAMSLFRRKFNRDPSKYPNQRIAFLDQDLISTMLKDYKQFQPDYRCFKFREYYEDQVNGTAHCEAATNKKWFVDVDHLYAYLFVNGNHWVALDIDLTKKRVNVYDSIPSLTTDTEMAIQCMFVMTMIPAMLSSFIPSKQRRRSYSKLEWKRITKIPENLDPGDCAIYSIKYIECLALGKSFDGLCDENMQSLRTKLAVEMFEEIGENAGTLHSEVRCKAFKFPSLMDE
ncbi:putative Ulp1 protease family catalytic domain, papain-like cysteine peptidase superfamily [Arabidopsis thaliana]